VVSYGVQEADDAPERVPTEGRLRQPDHQHALWSFVGFRIGDVAFVSLEPFEWKRDRPGRPWPFFYREPGVLNALRIFRLHAGGAQRRQQGIAIPQSAFVILGKPLVSHHHHQHVNVRRLVARIWVRFRRSIRGLFRCAGSVRDLLIDLPPNLTDAMVTGAGSQSPLATVGCIAVEFLFVIESHLERVLPQRRVHQTIGVAHGRLQAQGRTRTRGFQRQTRNQDGRGDDRHGRNQWQRWRQPRWPAFRHGPPPLHAGQIAYPPGSTLGGKSYPQTPVHTSGETLPEQKTMIDQNVKLLPIAPQYSHSMALASSLQENSPAIATAGAISVPASQHARKERPLCPLSS